MHFRINPVEYKIDKDFCCFDRISDREQRKLTQTIPMIEYELCKSDYAWESQVLRGKKSLLNAEQI